MDYNVIVGIVLFFLGVANVIIGWFAREIWSALKELRAAVHTIEVDLPKNYTAKDDFNAFMKEVSNGLQRIYDKLDGKADKS